MHTRVSNAPGHQPLEGQKPSARSSDQHEGASFKHPPWSGQALSPAELPAEASLVEREAARRGRLASTIILVFLLLWSGDCLYELADGNAAALPVFVIGLLILGLAFLLNWGGHVMMVGVLLVLAIYLGYLVPIVASHQRLDVIDLRIFALLVESVLVAAFLLPLFSIPLVTLSNILFLLLLFFGQPHTPAFAASLQSGLGIRALEQLIGLHLLVAVIAYTWVRSTERALARAERAELITELKQREVEHKRALGAGIEHLLETQVRAANGDLQVRATLHQQHVLWRLGASLNTLLARLQRAVQAERLLQRTEEEVTRLVEAIHEAKTGRRPIWPTPSGTPLDRVLQELPLNQP
jgi:hypothetical protein